MYIVPDCYKLLLINFKEHLETLQKKHLSNYFIIVRITIKEMRVKGTQASFGFFDESVIANSFVCTSIAFVYIYIAQNFSKNLHTLSSQNLDFKFIISVWRFIRNN